MGTEVQSNKLQGLATTLSRKFERFEQDRKPLEASWLRSLRQVKGIYDPEIDAKIPPNRSRVYPKATKTKLTAFVAKFMEMLFPANDKNFTIAPSPVPELPEEVIQQLIDNLTQQKQAQAEAQAQQMEEGQQPPQPQPPTSEEIERVVREEARRRADKMELEVDDQLERMDFQGLSKRIVQSAGKYSVGVLRGPTVETVTIRSWKNTPEGFKAVTEERNVPGAEVVRVWDWYPDLTAPTRDKQTGCFQRHIFNRADMQELTEDKQYLGDVIKKYLKAHPRGNYSRKSFEQELINLKASSKQGDGAPEGNTDHLFEVMEYTGFLSAHEVREMGVNLSDSDMAKEYFVNVWQLDNLVIRYNEVPFGEKVSDIYHEFIFGEDDDTGMLCESLPEVIRDSQLGICAASRMVLDNAGTVAGPMSEVNADLLVPGQDVSMHPFKVYHREGVDRSAGSPAVRSIVFDSHITELLAVVNFFKQWMDEESNLPQWTIGGGSEHPTGEALRTSGNMSMMVGGANLVLKDIVRSFDAYTGSYLKQVVAWNNRFGYNEEAKGDYQVITKGATSLVAKEIRAQSLDQMTQQMRPEDWDDIDPRKVLREKFRARDLPWEEIAYDEETAKQNRMARQQAAQQASQIQEAQEQAKTQKLGAESAALIAKAQESGPLTEAQIQKIVSETAANLVNTKLNTDTQTADNFDKLFGGGQQQ